MNVACEHCGARLNLPDEKIPDGRRFSVTCPKCQKRFTVVPPSPSPKPEPRLGAESSPSEPEADFRPSLEYYGEGVRLALILPEDTEIGTRVASILEELGFRPVQVRAEKEAFGWMNTHEFDLMVLFEGVAGADFSASRVLSYLAALPMAKRRDIFLVLVGSRFKTMDAMTAYAWSADMVLNSENLDTMQALLAHALSEHEEFYRTFKDAQEKIRKI